MIHEDDMNFLDEVRLLRSVRHSFPDWTTIAGLH